MRTSQAARLLKLLSDGQPHSTIEIMEKVYGGEHLGISRAAARIYDLKAKGHDITGWKDAENHALHWYSLKARPKPRFRIEVVERGGVRYGRRVEL